jgi:hypothetical protein
VEHEQRERRQLAPLVDEELGIRDVDQPTSHHTSASDVRHERAVSMHLLT